MPQDDFDGMMLDAKLDRVLAFLSIFGGGEDEEQGDQGEQVAAQSGEGE